MARHHPLQGSLMAKTIASIKLRCGPAWVIAFVLGMMVFVPISAPRSQSWEWYRNEPNSRIQIEFFDVVLEQCYEPAAEAARQIGVIGRDEQFSTEDLELLFFSTSLAIGPMVDFLSAMSWETRQEIYGEFIEQCQNEISAEVENITDE